MTDSSLMISIVSLIISGVLVPIVLAVAGYFIRRIDGQAKEINNLREAVAGLKATEKALDRAISKFEGE